MFTSIHTSSNPYPFHLSSPSFPNIPHHQHDDDNDLLVGHLLPAGAPPVSMAGGPSGSQAVNAPNPDPPNPLPKKQPAAKKDRHSKIDTAQGRRDRRVRLSIGIARKFFDLQDMLGFDKASKTLDWLLTKSKTAITELEHSKFSCIGAANTRSTLPSKCLVSHPPEPSLAASKTTKPGANRGHRAAFGLVAKESRANARARARERTREKMSTRKNISESTSNQFKSSETATSKKLESHAHFNMSSLRVASEMDNNPNTIAHHWGIGGTVKRSTFCALTNVNLPTEFQISGKTWEVYSTHSHH